MIRTSQSNWPAYWTVILCALCLSLLTLAASVPSWRFEVVEPKLLKNSNFERGAKFWTATSPDVRLVSGTPRHIEMSAASGAGWLGRRLPQSEDFDHLRITARASSTDLQGAISAGKGGRLSVVSIDVHGKRLWYLPSHVLRLEGTQSWRTHSAVIPIPDGIRSSWLVAFAIGKHGVLRLAEIQVAALAERGWVKRARVALAVAWMAFAAAVLWRLALAPGHLLGRVLTLTAAVGVTTAATAPQPHLNNLVVDGQNQAIEAAQALRSLPDLLVRSHSPQTSSSSPTRVSGRSADTSETEAESSSTDEDRAGEAKRTANRNVKEKSTGPNSGSLPKLRPPTSVSDKVGHLFAFTVLGFLAGLTYSRVSLWLVSATLFSLSGLIQIAQHLSVTREPDLADLAFDVLGIALGTAASAICLRLTAGRIKRPPPAGVAPP